MSRVQQGQQPIAKHVSKHISYVKTYNLTRVRRLYDQYSFSMIPLMGTILAGDRDSYQYLVESIRKFPCQEDFSQMIRDAGFATAGAHDGGAWSDLWGGIACIHKGVKL